MSPNTLTSRVVARLPIASGPRAEISSSPPPAFKARTSKPSSGAADAPGQGQTLGAFLRDRRARLQPETGGRRRTPGLRREEVAARAGVSVTWYTWLEQGRGGPPSDEVLERLVRALELDAPAREMLFLLARRRPPPLRKSRTSAEVSPAVQRVLDAMPTSPAFVRTTTWDILAWNAAAAAVLGDFGATSPRERNGLRRLFGNPQVRAALPDWEENARFVVAVFRVDLARSGGSPEAAALLAELQATSADFRRFWAENEVRSDGVGRKRYEHPIAGPFTLEHASFKVEGADGLAMVVFTPVSAADIKAIETLIARRASS